MGQSRQSRAERLRSLLSGPMQIMPGVYDALSARLVERAGLNVAFMSGYMVSASRLGMPDTGLISYAEMVDQGRDICAAVDIPVVGDADTGYGNAVNVRRTVEGYARAGFACAMIEDQVSPKRCGHTRGKMVVDRDEALARVRAAVDVREEGADILIMARTDACATDGIDEAIRRGKAFVDAGVDIVFVEAPETEREMERICKEIKAPQLANMVEQGKTPFLPPRRLEEIGYKLALYPATLLSSAIFAIEEALVALKEGRSPERMKTFPELCDIVGFNHYYEVEKRYTAKD